MSRKAAREAAVQIIYEYGFHNCEALELINFRLSEDFKDTIKHDAEAFEKINGNQYDYLKDVVLNSIAKSDVISEQIKMHSIRWNLNRISRIARAIMQVALYEIQYRDDIPEKVAINEAVEIAKKYDTPETVALINGVLGGIVRKEIR